MKLPIYCISMTTTPDRHARAVSLFKSLGIPVHFHIAQRDSQGGRYGCWRSHLAVWRAAAAAGHDIVVVFEDDVEIGCSGSELLRIIDAAVAALQRDAALEVVHLHNNVYTFDDGPEAVRPGQGISNCAAVVHVGRLLARPAQCLQPTGNHLDYEMFLHLGGPMFMKTGVVTGSPVTTGSAYGTSNNYGPLLNSIFQRTGLGPVVIGNVLRIHCILCRALPCRLRRLLPRVHVVMGKWFEVSHR